LGILFKKTVQFQGKLFQSTFLQAAVAGPILGNDLRKFKVIVSPEISQIEFACLSSGPARQYFAFSGSVRLILFV
jgi:hypothetical protein